MIMISFRLQRVRLLIRQWQGVACRRSTTGVLRQVRRNDNYIQLNPTFQYTSSLKAWVQTMRRRSSDTSILVEVVYLLD